MTGPDAEKQIAMLLYALGTQTAEYVLNKLPPDRAARVEQQLDGFRADPPDESEVDRVLWEFNQQLGHAKTPDESPNLKVFAAMANTSEDQGPYDEDEPFERSDDPLQDLRRLSQLRLEAALRHESPRTVAIILNNLPLDKASDLLSRLPDELRDQTFMRLKERPSVHRELLATIIGVTIDTALRFDAKALSEEQQNGEERLAKILRTMDRKKRNAIMASLEESDGETIERIRELLYCFDDIGRIQDRCLQKLLAEIDAGTLAKTLKDADETIKNKVMGNLSKRAKASLEEEIELMGEIDGDELAQAQAQIVQVISQLDQRGELAMVE